MGRLPFFVCFPLRQPLLLRQLPHLLEHGSLVVRLHEPVRRPEVDRLDDLALHPEAAGHDDEGIRVVLQDHPRAFDAVDAGHVDVHDNKVRKRLEVQVGAALPVRGLADALESAFGENRLDRLALIPPVVHHDVVVFSFYLALPARGCLSCLPCYPTFQRDRHAGSPHTCPVFTHLFKRRASDLRKRRRLSILAGGMW